MERTRSHPTMKDVAKLAGVSTATVSAVINDATYVSAPLKERVQAAIARLGYAPSGIARSLRKQSTNLIGLVIADITNPFFTELVRDIGLLAQKKGYSLMLFDSDHSIEQEIGFLQLLDIHRADGVILAPAGRTSDYLKPPVSTYTKPLVMVDRIIADSRFDLVSIDNFKAAHEATSYIASLGHRRVAILAGARHLSNTVDRLEGFKAALGERGLTPDPTHVIFADYQEENAYQASLALFGAPDRPTAIFVSNNLMLVGVMRALAELGLACPRDISIAAIDDFPWADTFTPRLTTVHQPVRELAEASLELLLERLAGRGPAEPRRLVFPARLIIRGSCRALDSDLAA